MVRYTKKIRSLLLLAISIAPTVFGAKQPVESWFIVHDRGRLSFTKSSKIFEKTQAFIMSGGVAQTDHLSGPTLQVTHASDIGVTVNNEVPALASMPISTKPLIESSSAVILNEKQLNDVKDTTIKLLGGELDQLGKSVEKLRGDVRDIIKGTYDLPLTALSSQDAARLNQRCAALERQFDSFDEWAKNALSSLPVMPVISENSSLAALTPYLQQKRGGSNMVGATLSRSVSIPSDRSLDIKTTMMLSGNGESIAFAPSSSPQLRVYSGAVLTLENITFKNLYAHSIVVEEGARIVFGDNVRWEFRESMTLSSGRFEIAGNNTIVEMVGIGATPTLAFKDKALFSLYTNTCTLHNMMLEGVERCVSHTAVTPAKNIIVGAIALCGNARIVAENKIPVGVLVTGRNNELFCRSNMLTLYEPIVFADSGCNELAICLDHVPLQADRLQLLGETFMVTSTHGTATLTFKNPEINVQLSDPGSFVVGEHGVVDGGIIRVSGNPIVSVGSEEMFVSRVQLESVQDNAVTDKLPDGYGASKQTALQMAMGIEPSQLKSYDVTSYTHSMHMRAMQGNVVINGGTITEWGMAKSNGTHIRLRNGGTLIQGAQPVVVRENDTLYVHDRGNEIIINGSVQWKGSLNVAQHSELTITCNAGSQLHIDASMIKAWKIADGGRLVIRGAGSVVIIKDFHLSLSDLSNTASTFCLSDGISCEITSGAIFRIGGQGSFVCDGGALCALTPGSQWFFGVDPSDKLNLVLDRQSMVIVGHTVETCTTGVMPKAILSCALGTFSLTVQRASTLYVSRGSMLELNMRCGNDVSGICSALRFLQGGSLYIAYEGMMVCGQNRFVNARREPISWQEHDGGIYGDGMIRLPSMKYDNASIYAICQRRIKPFMCKGIVTDMFSLVGQLINLSSNLISTLYFVNSMGATMVHTKGLASVILNSGDRIIKDTTAGVVTGAHANGNPFSISPNGTLIEGTQ